MLLENRNAVVYGAGGSIGSAVATSFAREGARVFLVGRTRETLERVANEITASGGWAGVAVFDALDSGSAHGSPMMGGTGPADAATDTLVRNLAAEIGPSGVRVVGLWTAGIPESLSPGAIAAVTGGPAMDAEAFQGLLDGLDRMRMTRRSPTLAQLAATAAFLASDGAGAITGTFVNATSGMFAS